MAKDPTIEEQIIKLLPSLSDEEKKAVLSVIKAFKEGDDLDLTEIDRRTEEYENGTAKVLSIDQLEAGARKAYKAKKK